jgi:hypothetical protein
MQLNSDIQWRRGHKPLLAPDPAGKTHWNGCIDKTIRANQIMGDLCEANNILLAPNGDDFSMMCVCVSASGYRGGNCNVRDVNR